MADEVTIGTTFQYIKNGLTIPLSGTIQVDATGDGFVHNVQTVGFAAHEAMELNDVGTAGYCYAKNIDATNFVQLGLDVGGTFYPFGKLLPGEIALVRVAGTWYAKADTAAVKLAYFLAEN